MKRFHTSSFTACAAVGMLALTACGGGDSDADKNKEPTGPERLLFATWWGGSGEQEAVAALTQGFLSSRSDTDVEIVPLTNDHGQQIKFYTGRLVEGCEADCESGCNASCIDGQANGAWDVGQENLHFLNNTFNVTSGGTDYVTVDLASVNALSSGLEKIRPEVRSALVQNGETVALPIGLHRANTLHYNPALVPNPPGNLEELRAMCDDYEQNGGVRPLAMAWADWIHSFLFQGLLPVDVLSGDADVNAARTAVHAALAQIKDFYDRDCIATPGASVGEHDWGEAARMIIGDEDTAKAKMFIHGDWAKGLLFAEGRIPGTDFAVTSFTGDDRDAFRYIGDTIAVNEDAENMELAIEFAEYALSPEGQSAFNEQKGSTPAIEIEDPELQVKNAQLRSTYLELQAAVDDNTFMPAAGWFDEVVFVVAKLRPKFVNAAGDLVDNPDFETIDLDALADEMMPYYGK